MLLRNKALWLDIEGHVNSLIQSEWVIPEKSSDISLTFVYYIDSMCWYFHLSFLLNILYYFQIEFGAGLCADVCVKIALIFMNKNALHNLSVFNNK